jgi:hypothetical protein
MKGEMSAVWIVQSSKVESQNEKKTIHVIRQEEETNKNNDKRKKRKT